MYYIYYKRKIAGKFEKIDNDVIESWKQFVDSGAMESMPDTEPLNEDMIKYPDDVHIICYKSDLEGEGVLKHE